MNLQGEQDPEKYIRAMLRTARRLSEEGEPWKGVELAWEAADSANTQLGNPFLFAEALRVVSDLLREAGDFAQSEQYYRETWRMQQITIGEGDPRLAETLYYLGFVSWAQQKVGQAEQFYRSALALQRKVLPPGDPALVSTLNSLALVLWYIKEYAQAEPLYREALTILGKSPDIRRDRSAILANLAQVYIGMEAYSQAESLLEESFSLLEAEGQAHSLEGAQILYDLAQVYQELGRLENALNLLQQALQIRRALLPEDHPDISSSLVALENLHQTMGNYREAISFQEQILTRLKSLVAENDPLFAEHQSRLAWLYLETGQYPAAEPLFVQALQIHRSNDGDAGSRVAEALNNLAELYRRTGRYSLAEPLYWRALELAGVDVAENEELLGVIFNNYGLLASQAGQYAQAEKFFRIAIPQIQSVLGEDHPVYATAVNNLALLKYAQGDYNQADLLYREALNIRLNRLGSRHPDVATTLNSMGNFYLDMGSPDEAEELYRQALAIRREVLGDRHPDVARTLNNLGSLYLDQEQYELAEKALEEAVRICSANPGGDPVELARSLNNLSRAYLKLGRFEQVEPLLKGALEAVRQQAGESIPEFFTIQSNLALLQVERGDLQGGIRLVEGIIAARRRTQGQDHPEVGQTLDNLSVLYMYAGDWPQAFRLAQEAERIYTRTTGKIFAIGSERHRLAHLARNRGNLYGFLALASRAPIQNRQEAVRSAFDLVLRRKALGFEGAWVQRMAVLGGRYPELKGDLMRLVELQQQLVRRLLGEARQDSPQATEDSPAGLADQIEAQQAMLARQIPEMSLAQQMETVDAVEISRAQPEGSTLVEFVRYVDFDFSLNAPLGQKPWKSPRYLAFILRAGDASGVQMVDLGEAEHLDGLVDQYRASITGEPLDRPQTGIPQQDRVSARGARAGLRQALDLANRQIGKKKTSPQTEEGMEVGWALKKALFDPLRAALNGSTRLILAPDGNLTRLPFEVLPIEKGRYWIDEYQTSYLSAGRDVLRFSQASDLSPTEPLVIADPEFDLGRPGISSGEGIFRPLQGTRQEGQRVAAWLKVEPLVKERAVERDLKNTRSPRILHLATHGFFLPDPDEELDFQPLLAPGTSRMIRLGQLSNPLLRSGLALAGANSWLLEQDALLPAEAEDGLLTAEDVTTLDLLATELVVLSACDTGLGHIQVGEGVFGLRRAFMLAGARTLVMSLWKVPDEATRELMELFYANLIEQKLGRAEALRRAQLAMKDKYRHPFYWGAFICQGDPGPLHLVSHQDNPHQVRS